jgi:hypothetical protein
LAPEEAAINGLASLKRQAQRLLGRNTLDHAFPGGVDALERS